MATQRWHSFAEHEWHTYRRLLTTLRQQLFDLVITDQVMPNLTGTQLAKELISTRPDIPVILCTGFPESVSMEDVNNIGIKKLIMKPISKHDIATIVREVLDKRK